jgi:anti-anti-sigma factor
MDLTVSRKEGYVLAATTGQIDDSADGLFREHLFSLLAQSGTNVVLDLSQSQLITSHGIGHLVSLAAHANTNSSRVILAACSPFVSIVLSRCKLDGFFETADSVDAAVRRIRGDEE